MDCPVDLHTIVHKSFSVFLGRRVWHARLTCMLTHHVVFGSHQQLADPIRSHV